MRLKFRVLLSEQVVALPLRALWTVRELFSISERPSVNCLDKLLLRHGSTTAIYPKKPYLLTNSPKSCDKEKLSIPLEPHHKAQSSEIFLSFQAKKRAEFFLSFGQSC